MSLKNFAKALILTVLTLPVLASTPDADKHESDHNEHTEAHETNPVDTKEEIKAYIQHHLEDTHHFGVWDQMGWSFPLPVILVDNGLQVFSSSKFADEHHHHSAVAEHNGNYYKLNHGKVYKTDAAGTITLDEEHHATNEKPLDLSITKNVAMIILTGLLMLWLFSRLAKGYASNNGMAKGVGRFLEPLVIFVRDEIAINNIGEKRYKKYMPFLLSVFFFIWILNLFGMSPLAANVTGNIAVTISLALVTFVLTNVTGTKDYWLHIFDPLGDSMPWIAKIPIYIILIPIEILGIFVKPFALLVRLYANIKAGHIVLMSLIGLIYIFENVVSSSLSFVLTFAISLIEFLVAFLQAYIFTMLSALYFGFASVEHEHAH